MKYIYLSIYYDLFHTYKSNKMESLVLKLDNNKYIFFYQSKTPFSQWHPSKFVDMNGNMFNCSEQWMMYCKALLHTNLWHTNKLIFEKANKLEIKLYHATIDIHNKGICKKILSSKSAKEIKLLGRLVEGFNNDLWNSIKMHVVECGNFLKFSQNSDLKSLLLKTGEKIIVEASPYDKIWGIGFTEDKALQNKQLWGQNLLGIVLMNIRTLLRGNPIIKSDKNIKSV